ncbi:MAG: hypothetical protein V4445_04275 [Pseudomonadota bacterium]
MTKNTDSDSLSCTQKLLSNAASKGSVDKDFYGASLFALNSIKADGLEPFENVDGELEYSLQQGLKAACHGREETAAILLIQKSILERLDTLKSILIPCLLLLCYIAYRVS